jgi:hypothetical protein
MIEDHEIMLLAFAFFLAFCAVGVWAGALG